MVDFAKLNAQRRASQQIAVPTVRRRIAVPPPPPAAPIEEEAFINKYRPKDWADVVGQSIACKQVDAARAVNTKAFLFHGPSGCGKTTMARILASKLAAEVLEIDGASQGGVDDVKRLVASLTYQSLSVNGRRLVILDECHRLSKEAWTVLLKPTEEPGVHVFFALCTTEPTKVPPTIRTRLAAIELKPVPQGVLFELLDFIADQEQFRINGNGLRVIAEAAEGSPRLALSLLAGCNAMDDVAEVRTACAFAGESPEVIELARGIVNHRLTWPQVANFLQAYEGQAESVRLLIVNYVAKALASTTDAKKAMPLLAVLEAFEKPCNPSEKMAPLLLAFGRVLLA